MRNQLWSFRLPAAYLSCYHKGFKRLQRKMQDDNFIRDVKRPSFVLIYYAHSSKAAFYKQSLGKALRH